MCDGLCSKLVRFYVYGNDLHIAMNVVTNDCKFQCFFRRTFLRASDWSGVARDVFRISANNVANVTLFY